MLLHCFIVVVIVMVIFSVFSHALAVNYLPLSNRVFCPPTPTLFEMCMFLTLFGTRVVELINCDKSYDEIVLSSLLLFTVLRLFSAIYIGLPTS